MGKHTIARSIIRVCPVCNTAFETGSSIKEHCSPECRIRDAASAFNGRDACWEWSGSRNPKNGYGQLSGWEGDKRKLYTAHRVSFRAFVGPIPPGQQVLHTCDNRPCFNPSHLFLGSQLANMHDMIAKGRERHLTPQGSRHHATKITEADVEAIRASTDSLEDLSARYGMSKSALSGIRTRRTWKHVA
jgi:hypothetical protein